MTLKDLIEKMNLQKKEEWILESLNEAISNVMEKIQENHWASCESDSDEGCCNSNCECPQVRMVETKIESKVSCCGKEWIFSNYWDSHSIYPNNWHDKLQFEKSSLSTLKAFCTCLTAYIDSVERD